MCVGKHEYEVDDSPKLLGRESSYYHILRPSQQSTRGAQRNPQSLHPRSILPSSGSIRGWNRTAKTRRGRKVGRTVGGTRTSSGRGPWAAAAGSKSQGAGNATHCTPLPLACVKVNKATCQRLATTPLLPEAGNLLVGRQASEYGIRTGASPHSFAVRRSAGTSTLAPDFAEAVYCRKGQVAPGIKGTIASWRASFCQFLTNLCTPEGFLSSQALENFRPHRIIWILSPSGLQRSATSLGSP